MKYDAGVTCKRTNYKLNIGFLGFTFNRISIYCCPSKHYFTLTGDNKDNTGKSVEVIKVFTESVRFFKDNFLTMFTSHSLGAFNSRCYLRHHHTRHLV